MRALVFADIPALPSAIMIIFFSSTGAHAHMDATLLILSWFMLSPDMD